MIVGKSPIVKGVWRVPGEIGSTPSHLNLSSPAHDRQTWPCGHAGRGGAVTGKKPAARGTRVLKLLASSRVHGKEPKGFLHLHLLAGDRPLSLKSTGLDGSLSFSINLLLPKGLRAGAAIVSGSFVVFLVSCYSAFAQ